MSSPNDDGKLPGFPREGIHDDFGEETDFGSGAHEAPQAHDHLVVDNETSSLSFSPGSKKSWKKPPVSPICGCG